MEVIEIFQVLGIEETKDETAIKQAYREKLSVTNPEDNPEGFKRLRAAYEEACMYAKTTDEEAVQEEDTTPSGLWVQKVAEVYGNINSRRDVACWNKLFEEDIFLSLEEEENCRFKLLRFLMDNYKLPTDVWKLLDEKIHITDNNTELREQFPSDFVNYLLNRCRQGEDLVFEQFEGAPDAHYDLFIQYMERCWQAIREEQPEQVEEFLKNADDLEIYHPSMEYIRAWLWEQQGKTQEAVQWMLNLWKKYDRDIMVSFNGAELLWRNEHKEEAVEIYEAIKKNINEQHYMANVRLTQWYFEKERYQDAKACAEEVLALGGDNDEFHELLLKINRELEQELLEKYNAQMDYESGVELGFCYLQDGRYAKGIALAKELESIVPAEKVAEYNGLLTKLYVEGADFKEAIRMAELWEETLQKKLAGEQGEEQKKEREADEDRIGQSLAIRLHSYHKLGLKDKAYLDKAIETVERMDRLKGDKPGINMSLEKAQIYIDMGEYEKCLEITTRLIEEYQVYAAYAIAQKAYGHMWDARGVVENGYMCIRYYPDYDLPYEKIAKVYLDLKYTEDLERILNDAQQAGIKSVFLDAYRYQMSHTVMESEEMNQKIKEFRAKYMAKLEAGNREGYEEGLSIITEYLYHYPGAYLLMERGLYYREAGEYEKAENDFKKALLEEPSNPYAYNALAYMYMLQGKYEAALICKKMAILYYEEEYVRPYADMGDLYSLLGLSNMAKQAYEQVLRVGGEKIREDQYYMRRYAMILANCGQTDEAVAVINKAYPKDFQRYEELAEIFRVTKQEERARLTLQQWSKAIIAGKVSLETEEYRRFYDSMAWQELVFGDGHKAIESFEREIKAVKKKGKDYGYADLIFTCILYGQEELGRHYAAKLMEINAKEEAEGTKDMHEMQKARLQKIFLSRYYTASDKELQEILEREKDTTICYFCTYCLCKELEAVRILYMLRTGQKEEAMARVERNLQKQPLDEYMLAIKNRYENQGRQDEKESTLLRLKRFFARGERIKNS